MKKISNKDTTSRLDADEILKETEEKYRLLLESSGKRVGLYSLDGKVLLFNQKSIQNLGGKAEDNIVELKMMNISRDISHN